MQTHGWKAALVTASLLALVPPVAAQERDGSLTVTVRDAYGVLPGASVRVISQDTQKATRAVTDGSGVATISGLTAGSYLVRASQSGFADSEQAVILEPGQPKAVEMTLALAKFSTSITVTTANRREQLLLDVAEPTTLIDQVQILDTGSRTAKDLLVQQAGSGVQVNAGGGQGYVSLNGIPNSGVLVLIDGRRFLGRDANGNFNLEEIQLAGIERVEIVKGPASALYGADGLGGVINFVTTKAKNPGWRNSVSLTSGTYGDHRASDTLDYRHGRGSVSAYGSYRTYDGFDLEPLPDPPVNPQTIGQPASKFWNGGLSTDFQFGSKVIGRLFADYNDRHIDPYYFSGATQLASTVYNSIRDLTRYMVSPEIEVLPASNLSFNVTYNYGRYVRDERQVYTVGGRVVQVAPWREWNKEIKAVARYTWTAGGQEHPLQAGYENRKEKLRRATLNRTDPERDINVFWAQQELALGSRVRLVGGFRHDEYSDFGGQWSPKGSILVKLAESLRVKGSVGVGFRPPLFGELYLSTPPFFVGNPDLKPEKNKPGWSAGYAYSGSRAQFSMDYFTTNREDGIVFDLTKQPVTYGPLRELQSKGVNVNAAVNLPFGFAPSVSYTYNKRVNARGEEIGGFPKHTVFATLPWHSPRLGMRANLRFEYNGDIPPGATDTSYQPAYSVWYAQVSKTFARTGPYAFRLWAQAGNIFDKDDIFRRQTCPAVGAPANCVEGRALTNEVLQVWIAPRTFQGGITVDMDWTK